ncbi:MAG: DUF3473 domain-containing protein [Candidatus Eisenbacteria bacterium]|uniref:DUF3473 domain-containing protein n=1 Tax=Eiseniibacteriota bacterium TaxID=2212470 RepID=A0A538TK26_UNCEI|nr:MAG: DUF3473 domain-containing protein [Candidatus Eisenbacteria bacterium]
MTQSPAHPRSPEPAFAMSVDVEEYFQVQAFATQVGRQDWERWPSRVEANVDRILEILEETRTRATFFVLGWVAERHAGLVGRIASHGHEIGSHGMSHRMLTELSPAEVRRELADSRRLLEDQAGQRVEGFRAPSYTVERETRWALDLLIETGYAYDSSIFPIRGRRYGYPEGPQLPTRVATEAGEIAEFPMSTIPVGPIRIPVLAGSYLRLLPGWVSALAVSYHLQRDRPLVVNVHPWEADPGQPTIGPSRWRAWSHYGRLASVPGTLRRVLGMARFGTVGARLRELGLLADGGRAREAAR